MSDRRNARPEPSPGEPTGGDWFYDELMTAQPDATREFYRARLEAAAFALTPAKTDL
jgi:hypothetical protein